MDNSGAVELSRDRKSCHRSRHVDRRYFKVRELHALGELNVHHIDTADNPADLLTKPLHIDAYRKHRNTLLLKTSAETITKTMVTALSWTQDKVDKMKNFFVVPNM